VLCAIAALLGRFLPRLGPLANASGPFFLRLSLFPDLLPGPVILSSFVVMPGSRENAFWNLDGWILGFRPVGR
jgi:hypothetical protein